MYGLDLLSCCQWGVEETREVCGSATDRDG